MKKLKGLLAFVLVFISAILVNNTKSFAAEVQYTDNVIPAMTSNTSPSGVASADTVYNNNAGAVYPAWLAFDHDSTTRLNGWVSKIGSTTGQLAYEFTDAKCVTKYTIISRAGNANEEADILSQMPKDWTFEAWDEQQSKWIVLDTQKNVTDWKFKIKKEFAFSNENSFKKYRVNVTADCGITIYVSIGELEMMETVKPLVPAPTNLTATVEKSNVNLSWDAVDGATSYNIKRSTTTGGPYETIATGSAISYTDTDVTPGTTYYYVVSAIVSGTEGPVSNEASAIIEVAPTVNTLKVVLETDEELQLSVDDDLDVNTEMIWTSSDNSVATVDGNGIVTALVPGNTVITVTSADGTYTDYINVLVVENADDYRLAVDLKVGKSCRLTVDDLTDTVKTTWVSMDPTIATVSAKGKVTAVSEGLTLITATDEEGNIIGQVYVRVRE